MKKKLLNIAIRVDANDQIGGGHFRRCLSLAEELKLRGHKILIISASLPIKFCQTLKDLSLAYKLLDPFEQKRKLQAKSEYGKWLSMPISLDAKKTTILLKSFNPHWVIFDNYALDFKWVDKVRKNMARIPFLAIDDLDNRHLGADVILDQTSLIKRKKNHISLTRLVGPSFTLLAKGYYKLREKSILERAKRLNDKSTFRKFSILISVGMYDPKRILPNLLETIAIIDNVQIDVTTSSDSQTISEIKKIVERYPNILLHLDRIDISFLMAKADLCIGASGMSVWERSCLALPTIMIAIVKNQRMLSRELKRIKAARVMTLTQIRNKKYLFNEVKSLINNPHGLKELSRNSQNLCDGLGVKRVAEILEANLRPVQIADSANLLEWRNKRSVREGSLDSKFISKEEHLLWMEKIQNNENGIWLIYSEGGIDIGHCNCKFLSKTMVVWSFYIGENFGDKGSGKRMLSFFLKYLFYDRAIENVYAEVLRTNFKSKLIHKHFGFTQVKKNQNLLGYSLSKRQFRSRFYSLTG